MPESSREDRIREEAFLLWNGAGRPEGRAEEYWYRAETIVDEIDRMTVREERRGNL